MAMIGFSFIELLVLVFLGGSPLGLPLSLPPLPEDPAMAQVAPQECLWYLSWSGCAKPDPASKNHTEQLIAEQEVQRFLRELETRLREAIKRGAPQGPQAAQAAVLAEEGPNLVKLVLTRPTAIFVESATVGPQGPLVKGGAVVSTGGQAKTVKQSIDRIAAVVGLKSADGELSLPMPQGAPPVELRWHEAYLVVGIGDGAAGEIIKRFGGAAKPPQWLVKVRKDLPVERPATVQYLNIRKALAAAVPFVGLQGFKFAGALGLDRLSHYSGVSGLDGGAAVTRSQLAIDGEPRGIFALLKQSPLTTSDLAAVPKDATFAVVGKLSAAGALAGLIDLVGQLDTSAQQQFKSGIAEAEKELGFKFSEDLLQSLGDTWSIYNSPGEGGLILTGLTGVVPVKDRQRLIAVHDKLLARVRDFNNELARHNADSGDRGRRPRGPVIADFKFDEHTIYFLNFIGAEAPFAPAWCITDKELIVSLFPQMIKARLSRASEGSLADIPEVAALFKRDTKPSVVCYQDTRTVFRLAYPLAHLLAAFVASELQQERVDIDISLLPSMAAIEPHLLPGVSALYFGPDGIRWESRHTLPGMGTAPLVLVAFGFFGFRSVSVGSFDPNQGPVPVDASILDLNALDALSPEAARRTVSTNNLKQIGLAMHNFADVHKRFPVADGAGGDGKPKLSWRVHILPFLEQQSLFNEFKLDEPWDSEHNKKLIEKMPKTYAAPGSKAGEKHKTNYLTVRGKDTMFPAGKAAGFGDIVDGTSNTAMVLEVNDERAVIWTKPDDFDPDKDDPLKGIVGLRNGKFLVLMGDGAVHTLPATLSKETVRALFTRAGGEVADFQK